MKINTKGRYALMAIVDVALHGSDIRPVSLYETSERLNLKLNYLEQLFSKLKKDNLVESVKGPGGGYYISKNLDEISITNVFLAVQESFKMTRCNEDSGCIHKTTKCSTHFVWAGLDDVIHRYFSDISIAEICKRYESK